MANRIPFAVAIFVTSLFFFLLGNAGHSAWDRDEPRYCQATREMLRTGDFIVPRFNGEHRYDKPPAVYWAMAPAMAAFGENEYAARFPAAVAGALRTTLIFFLALSMGCTLPGAALAAVCSAMAALLFLTSKAATTDSLLSLTVVVALYALWEGFKNGTNARLHALLWITIGVSILVKGPPGPLFAALTWLGFVAWQKLRPDAAIPPVQWSLPRLGRGLLIMLAVALPWAILVSIMTGGDFLYHSIGRHVVGRNFGDPTNNHTGPVIYYLLTFLPTWFPVTPLMLMGIGWGLTRLRLPAVRFLVCWFVPGFIILSLVSTKLPHYPAPLYPALAILVGLWWSDRGAVFGETALRWIGGVFLLLAGVGVIIASALLPMKGAAVPLLPILASTAVLGLGAAAAGVLWIQRRDSLALATTGASWTVGIILAMTLAVPALQSVRASQPLGDWLHANAPADVRVLAVEYQEPSFVFAWGEGVIMGAKSASKGATAEELARRPNRAAGMAMLADRSVPTALVTTKERWDKYQQEFVTEDGGSVPSFVQVAHDAEYFQFEKGRPIRMVIVTNFSPLTNH